MPQRFYCCQWPLSNYQYISVEVTGNYNLFWKRKVVHQKYRKNGLEVGRLLPTHTIKISLLIHLLVYNFLYRDYLFFLKRGVSSAHFMLLGNTFCIIQVLIKCVNGADKGTCAIRSSFPGILSYPVAFLILICFSFILMTSLDTWVNTKEFFLWPKFPRILRTLGCWLCFIIASCVVVMSSWKPIVEATFTKKSLKMSATFFVSVTIFSPSLKIMLLPFFTDLLEKNGDIVFQNDLSLLAQFF